MILIKHGAEPLELCNAKRLLRGTPDARYHYDSLPPSDCDDEGPRQAALHHLLREQGHLCAYCMRRIGTDCSPAHIEHWIPRSKGTDKDSLDFENMLAVCDGGGPRTAKKNQTCDRRRADMDLKLDPRNPQHIATLKYDRNGNIASSDPEIDEDINEHLNLNGTNTLLLRNRRAAYSKAEELIVSCYRGCGPNSKRGRDKVRKRLDLLSHQNDPYDEFTGVLIWRLKKHLKAY